MASTVTRRNLQSQFPDCDPQLIAEVLRDSHGDFNMAVNALRDMGMKDHSTVTRDVHNELSGLIDFLLHLQRCVFENKFGFF